MRGVLYVHGKGGSADEAERYRALFPNCAVTGLSYCGATPWEAGAEIGAAVAEMERHCDAITLIANSIGAFFSLHAPISRRIEKAYFISPIVDMEGLILGMLAAAGATEEDLRERGEIVSGGETLSWEYLRFVREHPIEWSVPTEILYGSRDDFTSREAIEAFARKCGAPLTVMDGGEHWFHTPEQLRFLDAWIAKAEQ